LEVDADGTTWSLPLDVAPITGGSVLLGLRPDAFTVTIVDGGTSLDVAVAAIEYLGNGTLVPFKAPGRPVRGGRGPAGHLWTARLDGFPPVRVGDRITLGLDLTSAYLFDATTGQALQSQVKVAVFV
jgi:hypothetical protein